MGGAGAKAPDVPTGGKVASATGGSADAIAEGFNRPGVVGGLCFTAGTDVLLGKGDFAAIETLEVGQRVLTSEEGVDLSATEVDPSTWRALELLMEDPRAPGLFLDVTVLRSPQWLAESGALEGTFLDLLLPEMGLHGPAKVTAIRPCPALAEGPGRVILATVQSYSNTVRELYIGQRPEPLEPTSGHPFYSEERADWVKAGALRVGEHIRTLDGPVAVREIAVKPGLHRVYNIEVETDHRYVVSDARVLSHNTNANSCAAPLPPMHVPGKSVVLGEGMEAIKMATKKLQLNGVDAKWYQAWSKNFPVGRRMTPKELQAALDRNERWIRSKIKSGYVFYDIGIDATRASRSPFYELEQRILRETGTRAIPIARHD